MLQKFNNWVLTTYVKKQEDLRMAAEKVIGNQRGMGAVEYGLVLAVIVIMVIAAAAAINDDVKAFFKGVIDKIIQQAGV